MVGLLRPVTALFISAAIVLCGNGLETVLLPLRADIEGFSRLNIGLIGSAYWLGITIGCIVCPRIIGRVGHPRAFTVFTAIATISPLLEAIWQAPPFWWLMRAITGMCFAGILTVLESWINSAVPNSQRGRVLAYYTITNFSVIMVGQQCLNLANPAGFHLFSLSAMLFSVAGVPLALTLTPPPAAPRRPVPRPAWLWGLSPAAVLGCVGAGLANSAFWALGPIYAKASGMPTSLIAFFMTCVVLGGALSQWPLGKLSDTIDRRRVMLVISIAASVLGVILALITGAPWSIKLILGALFGACALPIYWLSVAHANDYAKAGESVDVSSNLLLIFASAAIAGPLLGSTALAAFGPSGIFFYTALIHAVLAGLVFWRMQARQPIAPKERDPFVLIPEKSSPSVFEMDPRAAPGTGAGDPQPVQLRLVSKSASAE